MSAANGRLPPTHLRVLFEILAMRSRGERITHRKLAGHCGYKSTNAVHVPLNELRKVGLIDFQDFQGATIVPRCRLEVFSDAKGGLPLTRKGG